MMFEGFIEALGALLGTTTSNAGIFMALLVTMILLVMTTFTKKREPFLPLILSFVSTLAFTVTGWYPIWVGAVLGLTVALLGAWYFSQMGGGK
jgi:uncharacterized membrane protein (UPF0136 family)